MSQHELLPGRALREERTGDNNEKKKVEAASCHRVGGSERRIVTLQGFGGGGLGRGGFSLGPFGPAGSPAETIASFRGESPQYIRQAMATAGRQTAVRDPNLEAPPEHPWCHRRGRVTAFLSSTSASDQISLVQPQHAKWPVVRPSYRPPFSETLRASVY